jgi:hypothetical protein
MEWFKQQAKVGSNRWVRCGVVSCCLWIAGCQSLKEAAVVSTAAGVGAVAGTAISGGAIAPIVGAMTGAFVADATTEVLSSPAQTIVEAEANFFSILEKLVEIGGWALVLVFVGPMIIGWILPGPLERKKKS